MSIIDLLKQANMHLGNLNFHLAKECFEKALEFGMDEQTKNVIYEQLIICCNNLRDTENEMLYLELLISNEEYEDIFDASVSLAKLYRDTCRFDDMYRIGKKISALPHPENTINQPEQLYYELWLSQNEPDEVELERQRHHKFSYEPLISIVVPVYNVKIEYLIIMLDSICHQTYGNWEMYLADGNSPDEEIRTTIRNYAKRDSRIKYTFLSENLGISENTNAAILLCNGEYILFVDHDDCLTPYALFEIVSTINTDKDLDFIYSDHDHLIRVENRDIRLDPFFKPDWGPVLFEQSNYIVHPVIIKRDILSEVGLLNKKFDGCQDTDLILRIIEVTGKIHHIPKMLYSWRLHSESVSSTIKSNDPMEIRKKYDLMKSEHLSRINVMYTLLGNGAFEIIIPNNPIVSIIIVNRDNFISIKRCLESIYQKAGYSNFEVIIVDKGSIEKDTLEYYADLKRKRLAVIISQNENNEDYISSYASDYNYAAENAKGEYLFFMSGVSEMLDNYWLLLFLQSQQYPFVGLSGCKVIYTDENGSAFYKSGVKYTGRNCEIRHTYGNESMEMFFCSDEIEMFENKYAWRDSTAFDKACFMIKKNLFDSLGGFDIRFSYTFFLFDLCLKVRNTNNSNVLINIIKSEFTEAKDIYHADALNNYYEELKMFKAINRNKLDREDPFININYSVDNYKKNGCLLTIQN